MPSPACQATRIAPSPSTAMTGWTVTASSGVALAAHCRAGCIRDGEGRRAGRLAAVAVIHGWRDTGRSGLRPYQVPGAYAAVDDLRVEGGIRRSGGDVEWVRPSPQGAGGIDRGERQVNLTLVSATLYPGDRHLSIRGGSQYGRRCQDRARRRAPGRHLARIRLRSWMAAWWKGCRE